MQYQKRTQIIWNIFTINAFDFINSGVKIFSTFVVTSAVEDHVFWFTDLTGTSELVTELAGVI